MHKFHEAYEVTLSVMKMWSYWSALDFLTRIDD